MNQCNYIYYLNNINIYIYIYYFRKNIKFGGSSKGTLDVYYDKASVKDLKPVVIYAHGGAWIGGDKDDDEYLGKFISKDGYVAVSLNYILFPKGDFDDMVDDVYKAIQWTYNNIEKYGGNKNKITLSGYSAGAHLMALTTFKAALRMENNNKYLEPLPRAERLVLFNCPADFDDYDAAFHLFDDTSKVNNGIVKNIVSFLVNSKDVSPTDILQGFGNKSLTDFGFPTITVFHGGKDELVPAYSSENFIAQLKRVLSKTKVNDVYRATYDHATLVQGSKNNKELQKLLLDILKM